MELLSLQMVFIPVHLPTFHHGAALVLHNQNKSQVRPPENHVHRHMLPLAAPGHTFLAAAVTPEVIHFQGWGTTM